jgi:hypothetical protein
MQRIVAGNTGEKRRTWVGSPDFTNWQEVSTFQSVAQKSIHTVYSDQWHPWIIHVALTVLFGLGPTLTKELFCVRITMHAIRSDFIDNPL